MRFAPGALRWTVVAMFPIALAGVFAPWIGLVFVVLPVCVLYFFRDPERTPPDAGVLAPADGTVSVVREEDDRLRVGVFMNVYDVHVNRAPLSGTVTDVTHESGLHRPAFTKDSDRNEKVHIAVSPRDRPGYDVTLVAGAFARRIHPYVKAGDDLDRGQRIGHISFGSRADVLLPPGFDRESLQVEEGQPVRAGETIIATTASTVETTELSAKAAEDPA